MKSTGPDSFAVPRFPHTGPDPSPSPPYQSQVPPGSQAHGVGFGIRRNARTALLLLQGRRGAREGAGCQAPLPSCASCFLPHLVWCLHLLPLPLQSR